LSCWWTCSGEAASVLLGTAASQDPFDPVVVGTTTPPLMDHEKIDNKIRVG
jgi:hypothetical protein